MAAARCSICAVNYPVTHTRCQICDGPLDRLEATPHEDWRRRVEQARATGTARSSDEAQVEDWRLHVLIEAGYPPPLAERLAARPWHEVDLHHAVELIEGGCPPELAARILL